MQFEGESNIKHFAGLPPISFDRYANGPCRKEQGIYHSLAYSRAEFEPGAEPPVGSAEGSGPSRFRALQMPDALIFAKRGEGLRGRSDSDGRSAA